MKKRVRFPYRAWGHPWTTAAGLLGSLTFLATAVYADVIDPHTTYSSLFALSLLGGTVLLYGITAGKRKEGRGESNGRG